ncbi:retinol-binding protein pinta [Drosophila tropicalis]|uniref:retinol-binding protein pinta n=1 Tax=Drosophila tropicalis TaxID=46794 RepID=UPI0035AB7DA7
MTSSTYNLRPLSAGLQQIAVDELNEVPQRVATDIATLRDWLDKQPHLCSCNDEQFLLAFLRGTKFSLEKAKQKIDRFYTLQKVIPEVFNEHRLADDPQVLEIIRAGVILRIPLDAEDTGPAVTIIRACSYDLDKFKFQDIIRVGSMFGEIMMLEDDNATVSGYMEIMDMTGVTAANLFALQPQMLSKFSAYADEAMPTRQKGIHFLNVPGAFETGFNSLRSFFPEKIKNRVSVSSDPEAIFELIPRKYLPKEYGGTKGSVKDILEQMEAKILSYREYFQETQNYGCNEKLREDSNPLFKRPEESHFGADGSFRMLNID